MKKRRILSTIMTVMFFMMICQLIGLGKTKEQSMEPNLKSEKIVLINKCSYRFSKPNRGDIVAVEVEGNKYIKRVIGIPGDVLECKDGSIVVNGKVLEEPYIDEQIETNFVGTIEVAEGTYFLLGDNREVSYDSRHYGCIKKGNMVGRVVYYFDKFPGTVINQYIENEIP